MDDVTSNSLIKDPNECPLNASEIIGPEYAENVECYLGVYSGYHTYINLFRVFVSWKNIATTTQAPIKSTSDQGVTSTNVSPETHNITTVMTTTSSFSTAKEAKDLADTADRFKLNSNKISVNYDEIIGNGSTATVYKGFLHGNSALSKTANKSATNQKHSNCKVAIKIPKAMNRNEAEQIMRELQAMRQLGHHVHIAALFGWCFQNDSLSLVFELAQYDLFTYIRKFREPPDSCMPLRQTLSIAWQVSVGMEYVASFNMVHRDLAARNILLFPGFHAKISDFGLCCHCDESFTYYATINKKLPVRWLSIEALIDRRFSEKSDVWAFGVLLYEMCTNGTVPYTLLSNSDILAFIQSGKRLEKPVTTNTELYELMLNCWKESTEERLSFTDVTQKLHNQLEEETQNYGYLSLTAEEADI
uniref:Protein kinase domain-containing protein n=1 Tax=Panagrolaimus sp. ES5 TaxID=591445 RepID=A0AC34FXU0_9BILA